jgi:hypothetical protein
VCYLLQGYLTLADLYTFFREVHGLWVAMGEYADLDIYDVLDEVRCLYIYFAAVYECTLSGVQSLEFSTAGRLCAHAR